jgi:hypothetical protein
MPFANVIEPLVGVAGAQEKLVQELFGLDRISDEVSRRSTAQLDRDIDDPKGFVRDVLANEHAAYFTHPATKLVPETFNYL